MTTKKQLDAVLEEYTTFVRLAVQALHDIVAIKLEDNVYENENPFALYIDWGNGTNLPAEHLPGFDRDRAGARQTWNHFATVDEAIARVSTATNALATVAAAHTYLDTE
jgi:hypothetical protein